MKILIIGKGGREHALAWKFADSKYVNKVFVAPGNDGMKNVAEIININELDNSQLLDFAINNKIDLTFVGPESALENGIVDLFLANNLKIFGPTKQALQIESSKSYCKYIMAKYNIPTAQHKLVSDYQSAIKYLKERNEYPIVLKIDGLAAGKGVMIPDSEKVAMQYLKTIFDDKKFGPITNLVIEEYLEGEEFSFLAFVNENKIIPLQIAQDHKRAYDDDQGENTGGMGAYTPVRHLSQESIDQGKDILQKMADAMVQENCPFTGILYAGLMTTKQGVQVIEFNARFGDPETEVILPAMKSDIVDVINACFAKKDFTIQWSPNNFVGVVLASNNYPYKSDPNHALDLKSLGQEDLWFSMAIKSEDNKFMSNGGRVFIGVGESPEISKAKEKAYKVINKIKTEHFRFRKDIGYKTK